jgi:hypothetical protein
MVTYEINLLPGLEVSQPDLVVRSATYEIKATDGDNAVTWSSKVEFPPPSEDFTPFHSLTKQGVLEWVQGVHAEKIVEMEAYLANQLAEMVAPTVATITAPWAEV